MKGTPKTLTEAIHNALTELALSIARPRPEVIEKHVVDFLAQKFGAHELNFSGQETQTLWKAITGKDYGK